MKKIYFLTLFSLLHFFSAQSQWVADTSVRNVICNAPGIQSQPRLCVDGNKGAIICWADVRGTYSRIYAQHIDSSGYTHWTANGILVSDSTLTAGAINPEITTDSAGGAIICYETYEISDRIFAVRIDSMGKPVWAAPVPISVAYDSRGPLLNSDQNGGAIINWYAYTPGEQVQILLQWIDKNGNIHLPVNGLQITNSNSAHYSSHVAYAGDSSAYVIYNDNDTLRMQRFDSTGNIIWANPLTLSNTFSDNTNEYTVRADANGNSNAFVFWSDTRTISPGLYGQRIKENGVIQWTAGGNAIDTTISGVNFLSYAPDDLGGSYVAYGSSPVRVERINLTGQNLFTPPVEMCSGMSEMDAYIKADGNFGAIIAWQDGRGNYGVYGQRIDSSGNMLWRNCGSPVYTANSSGNNNDMRDISCSDGTGIAAFLFAAQDVYCAKIENSTNVGIHELGAETSMEVFPNPANGAVNIYLSNRENAPATVTFTDVTGRKLNEFVLTQQYTLLNPNLPGGIYFITLTGKKGSETKKLIIE